MCGLLIASLVAHQGQSQVVELRAGQSIPARSKSRIIHHVHHRTIGAPICTLHLQTILDLRERGGQNASVSGRRALTAHYLPRYARRALHTSHASQPGVSDLQDGACLGTRNALTQRCERSARQVQGAVRRWGVLRFPRSVSNGAARVTMRQLGVICMAPALANAMV